GTAAGWKGGHSLSGRTGGGGGGGGGGGRCGAAAAAPTATAAAGAVAAAGGGGRTGRQAAQSARDRMKGWTATLTRGERCGSGDPNAPFNGGGGGGTDYGEDDGAWVPPPSSSGKAAFGGGSEGSAGAQHRKTPSGGAPRLDSAAGALAHLLPPTGPRAPVRGPKCTRTGCKVERAPGSAGTYCGDACALKARHEALRAAIAVQQRRAVAWAEAGAATPAPLAAVNAAGAPAAAIVAQSVVAVGAPPLPPQLPGPSLTAASDKPAAKAAPAAPAAAVVAKPKAAGPVTSPLGEAELLRIDEQISSMGGLLHEVLEASAGTAAGTAVATGDGRAVEAAAAVGAAPGALSPVQAATAAVTLAAAAQAAAVAAALERLQTGVDADKTDRARGKVRQRFRDMFEAGMRRLQLPEASSMVLACVLAFDVESEAYEMLVQGADRSRGGNGGEEYRVKARSLRFNVAYEQNPDLFVDVLAGKVSAEELCGMTDEQLASRKQQEERQKVREESVHDHWRREGADGKAAADGAALVFKDGDFVAVKELK
ncbi:unnamed protein product, partial [Phaeothamnion confervicola]